MPRSLLWPDPRVKPPFGSVEIDRGCQLASGLFDALLFNEGGGAPVNLATPVPTILTSSPLWRSTQQGLAGYTTGGSSFDITNHHTAFCAGSLTCYVRFIADSWPGTYTIVYDQGQSSGVSLFINTSGVLQYMALGGITQDSLAAGSMPVGQVHSVAVVRLFGESPHIYVDGVDVKTATIITGGASVSGSQVFSYGKNTSGGGSHFDGKYLASYNFLRALTPGEVMQLHHEPYVLVRPIIRRRYFVGPQAYTLTAETAMLTLTGQAATLAAQRRLDAEHATIAMTGQVAQLRADRRLAADMGALTLAGQDATFTHGYHLTAETGALHVLGQDASVRRAAVLIAERGLLHVQGQAATLRKATAGAGAFRQRRDTMQPFRRRWSS